MDITIASLINLLSSGGLCYLGHMLHKKTIQLKEYEDTKLFTPSSLINELKQPNSLQNLKPNPKNPQEYILKAFIEGNVESRNSFKSRGNGESRLVYSAIYRKEVRTNDLITKLKGSLLDLSSVVRPDIEVSSRITLKDPVTSHSCEIKNRVDVDASGAVDKIDEKMRLYSSGVENLFSFFRTHIIGTSLTKKSLLSISGLSIGFTETEFGIKVGSALTVYGQVIYNKRNQSLRIDTPLYFLKEKATIIKQLHEQIGKICGGSVVLLVAFGVSVSYLVKKYIEHRRELKEKEKEVAVKKRFEKLQDDYKCIICVDNPRNVIMEPCRHLSICKTCYNRLPRKICPICKIDVEDTIRVSFCS